MEKKEAVNRLLEKSRQTEASLHQVLNSPLTFIQKKLVDGIYTLYFDVLGKTPEIDEAAAQLARERFADYFPETVEEMLAQMLEDPEAYHRKVFEFETACPPVSVSFPTNPSYYRVITSDPSRKLQEVLTTKALLSNFLSSNGIYRALDVGTGYGRLARVVEENLKYLLDGKTDYQVFGMDILEDNIAAAKELNGALGSAIRFFTGDMNKIPFPSGTLNLVNTTDASYLNFRHRRPLYIAEIARVLRPDGGVCCITNPNENTTLKEYNYVMMRTNYKTYLNPVNIIKATALGKCSIHIDALAKARPDWELTTTADMTDTLKNVLKADIIDISNWPKAGGPPIYSGFAFAVNADTEKALQRYTEFRESQQAAEEWFKI